MARTLQRKGFYTSSDYWGWNELDGEFHRFDTDEEYNQAIDELEQESESENETEVAV